MRQVCYAPHEKGNRITDIRMTVLGYLCKECREFYKYDILEIKQENK